MHSFNNGNYASEVQLNKHIDSLRTRIVYASSFLSGLTSDHQHIDTHTEICAAQVPESGAIDPSTSADLGLLAPHLKEENWAPSV